MFTRRYYTRTISFLMMIAGSVSVFMNRVSKEGWGIIFSGILLFFCSYVYRRAKSRKDLKKQNK